MVDKEKKVQKIRENAILPNMALLHSSKPLPSPPPPPPKKKNSEDILSLTTVAFVCFHLDTLPRVDNEIIFSNILREFGKQVNLRHL